MPLSEFPSETPILPQTPVFIKGKLDGSVAHGGIMKIRKVTSALALSVAVLVGTTGCSLSGDVASMQQYTPSDGSQIDIGNVKLRNFIYLTDGVNGGKLIGTFVNNEKTDISFQLEYIDGDVRAKTQPIYIPSGETLGLGSAGDTEGFGVTLNALPGSNVTMWVSIDGATGVELVVPVLDGTLEQYAPFFEN